MAMFRLIDKINNIKVVTLNKTLMMVLDETKFIKFMFALITNMRMTLARLTMGIMSLQENVNAIYELIPYVVVFL